MPSLDDLSAVDADVSSTLVELEAVNERLRAEQAEQAQQAPDPVKRPFGAPGATETFMQQMDLGNAESELRDLSSRLGRAAYIPEPESLDGFNPDEPGDLSGVGPFASREMSELATRGFLRDDQGRFPKPSEAKAAQRWAAATDEADARAERLLAEARERVDHLQTRIRRWAPPEVDPAPAPTLTRGPWR